MRLLFLASCIGCHASTAPAVVGHTAPPAPAPAPAPAARPATQDIVDALERHRPFDEQAAQLQRVDTAPQWVGATLEDGFYAFAQVDNHWVATAEPLVSGGRYTLHRIFDASTLNQKAMGYVISIYDGGSETGVERTVLQLVCAGARSIRPCGSVGIGYFVWALAAERRRDFPGAATSLDARPHAEVLLTPSFEPTDRINLSIKIDSSTLGELDDESRRELAAIRANAGRWKIARGELVRDQ